MKKIYLLLFLLPFLTATAQVPTCGFDYTWLALGKKGIWPDSATNFVSGTVGTPYTQNVTIVVPKDTNATIFGSTQNFTFKEIDLQTGISSPANYGLPPGLSITGTPSTFKFPGNDTSCMIIYGTPTTAGLYNLSFTLKAYVTAFPGIAVSTQTITYYKIDIGTVGIAANSSYTFRVQQNMPNPVNGSARVLFTSPNEAKAKFAVYNLTGVKIMEKDINAVRGDNNIDFETSQLESGIYLYTVEMNHQKQCRRMVVTH
ncbi:MAG: T9SS type A sorting domain-containing protein [Bacteroidia bacterium]